MRELTHGKVSKYSRLS